MLVLTRKKEQTIRVGDVTFKILRIAGDRVRVGIDAPQATPISRGELPPKPKPTEKDAAA